MSWIAGPRVLRPDVSQEEDAVATRKPGELVKAALEKALEKVAEPLDEPIEPRAPLTPKADLDRT